MRNFEESEQIYPEMEYRLNEYGGFIDANGNPVYCAAGGCEAQAYDLVGVRGLKLALCGACADVWYLGFAAGKEARCAEGWL